MRKNIIQSSRFKWSKAFFYVAIFTLVCMLLMVEKVAEVVVSGASKVGVNLPVAPMLSNLAANGFMAGTGLMLLMFSALIVVPVAKFAVIGAGIVFLGYGVWQIYKYFKGEPINQIIPRK